MINTIVIPPLFRCGNWSSEYLCNLFKDMELLSGVARIWTQVSLMLTYYLTLVCLLKTFIAYIIHAKNVTCVRTEINDHCQCTTEIQNTNVFECPNLSSTFSTPRGNCHSEFENCYSLTLLYWFSTYKHTPKQCFSLCYSIY